MNDDGGALTIFDDLFRGVSEKDGLAGSGRRGITDPPLALNEQGPDVRNTFLLVRTELHAATASFVRFAIRSAPFRRTRPAGRHCARWLYAADGAFFLIFMKTRPDQGWARPSSEAVWIRRAGTQWPGPGEREIELERKVRAP